MFKTAWPLKDSTGKIVREKPMARRSRPFISAKDSAGSKRVTFSDKMHSSVYSSVEPAIGAESVRHRNSLTSSMDSFEQLTSFRKFYAASERKPGNGIVTDFLALPRDEKKKWLRRSS